MSAPLRPAILGLVLTLVAPVIPSANCTTLSPLAGSRIWVTGTSTVRSFSCEVVKYGLGVEAARPNAADAVVAGEKAIGTVDLRIPVASMDCKNGTMNDHMREALKAKENPVISFTVSSYALVKAGANLTVTLHGALTIGGVQKAVTMSAVARNGGAGVLHLTGEYGVRMSTFGLKPPSLLFGTMKVGDDVQVHFDLLLGGQQAAPSPAATVPAPTPTRAPAPAPTPARREPAAVSVATPPEPTPDAAETRAPAPVGAPEPIVELAPAPPAPDLYTATAPTAQPETQRSPTEARMDTSAFDGITLTWGAAITQDFQHLTHRNTATPNIVAGVNTNALIGIGGGFNTAMANLNLSARLSPSMHVELVTYLSTRHHTNAWVKGGYLQMDGSPLPLPIISDLLKHVIVRVGQFEVNHGDAHFRRTDGGNGMDNPFVGNLIMDAFSTEIGADATYRRRGWIVMAGVTGGAAGGRVREPGQRSPAFLAKIGFDTTMAGGLRVRLAGSMYHDRLATNNVLYSGDRAGPHYFDVMENTTSSESANAWSGNIQPGFTHHVSAFVFNPLVEFRSLELFGNLETATGSGSGAAPDRTWRQQSLDAVYRVFDDYAYVAARFNRATGEITGAIGDRTDLTLGHEAVGIVHTLGSAVKGVKEGDRVAVCAITPCYKCTNCLRGFSSQCTTMLGGWKFANTKDGVFAEYFHVNDAEANLALIPSAVPDATAVYATDMMSTGFMGAEHANIPLGGSVVIFAPGPVGLMATVGARLLGAGLIIAVESVPKRQEMARHFGADVIVAFTKQDAVQAILDLTNGESVDSAIEALGSEVTFEACIRATRPGGTISNVGYHGTGDFVRIPRVEWGVGMSDKVIRTGLCPGGRERMQRLLRLLESGRVDPTPLTTHRFPFSELEKAFALMQSKDDGVIKPLVTY